MLKAVKISYNAQTTQGSPTWTCLILDLLRNSSRNLRKCHKDWSHVKQDNIWDSICRKRNKELANCKLKYNLLLSCTHLNNHIQKAIVFTNFILKSCTTNICSLHIACIEFIWWKIGTIYFTTTGWWCTGTWKVLLFLKCIWENIKIQLNIKAVNIQKRKQKQALINAGFSRNLIILRVQSRLKINIKKLQSFIWLYLVIKNL